MCASRRHRVQHRELVELAAPDLEQARAIDRGGGLVGDERQQPHLVVGVHARCQAVHQQRAESRWLGVLRAEVRAYHDVRMLEVRAFQSARQVAARYQYPNDRMFAQDEKYQQNRFMADWLEHCLQNGRAALEVDVPLKAGG